MNERPEWMRRLREFIIYLRDELQRASSTCEQYESVVERWIDHCLSTGHDPATFAQRSIDQFLDDQRNLKPGPRRDYTSNLRGWCRWASGEPVTNHRDLADESERHDEIATWTARLESYLHWRSWAGGAKGEGAKPGTIKTVRSVVSAWVRWACANGIDPGHAGETALGRFLDSKQDANDDTRSGYARHIRRWWKRQPLFMAARLERLARLVAEFREEGYGGDGYPCEEDREHKQSRARFEEILRALPDVEYENRSAVKEAWSNARFNYGNVGRAWIHADRLVDTASETEWPRIRSQLYDLCFGGSSVSRRIDVAIKDPELSGVKFLVATKLLAICHPEHIIPNYVLVAESSQFPGKLSAIRCLQDLALLDEQAIAEATAIAHGREESGDDGAIVMRANDLLLEALRPEFADEVEVDTWGMSQFLYWLMRKFALADEVQSANGTVGSVDDNPTVDDPLQRAANDLLCGVDFLNEVVELLEDKGQVILYGPPGTGKTYFAQRLAQALCADSTTAEAADEDWMQRLDAYCLHLEQDQNVQSGPHRSIGRRWIEFTLEHELDPSVWDESLYAQFADLSPDWQDITRKTHRYDLQRWCSWASGDEDSSDADAVSLVQFHPAYSYEDFFEGFRPQVDDDGQMTYKLTPGPLVRLAERAEEHPDELHMMVIDEINRANLPRVLGELLYLLEYRDEAIQTQYRPDDSFLIPENLWFIGTMNTADRSIALIDAAMRRRFHFVPFFPDREPTAGLLRRWCEQNESEQTWVADLLDGVNERLRSDLGGDHMLIGPSHFMKEGLDEDGVRRIWEYNIEPLIEDQFFGRREVIDSFRFREVWKRPVPGAAEPDSDSGAPDGSGADLASGPVHDEDDESGGDG